MNNNIQERYEKGYIRDDQLQKYVELGVVSEDEYLDLTGDEEYTGKFPYPVVKPYIDTSKLRYFNYFAAGESGGKNILITDEELDNIDTSNGIDFERMFYARTTTEKIPWIDTSKGTNFSGMFRSCNALEEIPEIDTSNGTNFNSMFRSCIEITSIPDSIKTLNGTDLGEMFWDTRKLKSIPNLDTSNNTNFGGFLNQSIVIEKIPYFDTSNGVNFNRFLFNTAMLSQNGDTEGTLTFDVRNGEDFTYAFGAMKKVKNIEFTNPGGTINGTKFEYMFSGDEILESISGLNLDNAESNLNVFGSCPNLKNINLVEGTYIHHSINLYGTLLSDDKQQEIKDEIKATIEKIIGHLTENSTDENLTIYFNYDTINDLYEIENETETTITVKNDAKNDAFNQAMNGKSNWRFYTSDISGKKNVKQIIVEAEE